jgi:hypothetical protein
MTHRVYSKLFYFLSNIFKYVANPLNSLTVNNYESFLDSEASYLLLCKHRVINTQGRYDHETQANKERSSRYVLRDVA